MPVNVSFAELQKRSYTAELGYANSSGRLEEAYKGQLLPYNWDTLYLTGIANVANSCYISEIMQYLSNHPKMTSVVDQLTPSHPSLCNIVSCPDLLWGKGSGDYWVLSCSWLCQVCSLNSEQANEIVVHQIKITSLAQPRKHSVVTRPFSHSNIILIFRSKM